MSILRPLVPRVVRWRGVTNQRVVRLSDYPAAAPPQCNNNMQQVVRWRWRSLTGRPAQRPSQWQPWASIRQSSAPGSNSFLSNQIPFLIHNGTFGLLNCIGCEIEWTNCRKKMTGETPEVHSDKSLTLVTFNIRHSTNGPMDQRTNGPMD